MKAIVSYFADVDIMNITTGPDIRVATSSSAESGLVVDYATEDGFDVVGIELWAAGKHLAPFCAATEVDAREARKVATKFPLKAGYNKEADILTVKSKYEIADAVDIGGGLIAYFGYSPGFCEPCDECYDMVGFELRNASECLAPHFSLNRAPLPPAGAPPIRAGEINPQ